MSYQKAKGHQTSSKKKSQRKMGKEASHDHQTHPSVSDVEKMDAFTTLEILDSEGVVRETIQKEDW
jgi:hypothetical protein